MKVTIEIWQNTFNDEWNCNITTTNGGACETEYWAVQNFVDILALCGKHFHNAKLNPKKPENES